MIKANIFIELFLTLNFCKFFWKEINDLKKLKYFLFKKLNYYSGFWIFVNFMNAFKFNKFN